MGSFVADVSVFWGRKRDVSYAALATLRLATVRGCAGQVGAPDTEGIRTTLPSCVVWRLFEAPPLARGGGCFSQKTEHKKFHFRCLFGKKKKSAFAFVDGESWRRSVPASRYLRSRASSPSRSSFATHERGEPVESGEGSPPSLKRTW